MAEDQHIVEAQVDAYRRDPRDHGDKGLLGLPKGAGIGVAQGEGQKTEKHDKNVFPAIGKGLGGFLRASLSGQVQADQAIPGGEEQGDSKNRQGRANQHLEPEGVADARVIPGAVELGREDSRAGAGAEDAQVENEHELVYNGHAAHGKRADAAHHDVIQEGNKIGDAVLNDDGQDDVKDSPVKRPVPDVLMEHGYLVVVMDIGMIREIGIC